MSVAIVDERPRLLDLFCCEGGAAVGYDRAGFRVYGVDIEPQPLYPFPFHHGDAIVVLRRLLLGEAVPFTAPDGSIEWLSLGDFAAIHASPPCQAHSTITPDKSKHVDLIPPTRELLQQVSVPWVIENVEGARKALIDPMRLCGSSFGLRVRRHRFFESSMHLTSLPCRHAEQGRPVGVYGDHPQNDHEYLRPDGTRRGAKAVSAEDAADAMGWPGATWYGATQAIPPAFAEWIGAQMLEAIR